MGASKDLDITLHPKTLMRDYDRETQREGFLEVMAHLRVVSAVLLMAEVETQFSDRWTLSERCRVLEKLGQIHQTMRAMDDTLNLNSEPGEASAFPV